MAGADFQARAQRATVTHALRLGGLALLEFPEQERCPGHHPMTTVFATLYSIQIALPAHAVVADGVNPALLVATVFITLARRLAGGWSQQRPLTART